MLGLWCDTNDLSNAPANKEYAPYYKEQKLPIIEQFCTVHVCIYHIPNTANCGFEEFRLVWL